MTTYAAKPGPVSGHMRVEKDGRPLAPEEVQAEILTLLARLVELAEAVRMLTPEEAQAQRAEADRVAVLAGEQWAKTHGIQPPMSVRQVAEAVDAQNFLRATQAIPPGATGEVAPGIFAQGSAGVAVERTPDGGVHVSPQKPLVQGQKPPQQQGKHRR